jgi:hypothetical protein
MNDKNEMLRGQLRVDIRDLAQQRMTNVVVTIKPLTPTEGPRPTQAKGQKRGQSRGPARASAKEVRLKLDKGSNTFAAQGLMPGRYEISVSSEEMETQSREVMVQPGDTEELFILGKKGLPSYFRGKVRVPFEVDPDLIAVSLRRGISEQERRPILEQLAERHGLQEEKTPEVAQRVGMQVFRMTGAARARRERLAKLREDQVVEHAGLVVSWREEGFTQLTDETVVRFKPHVTEQQAHEIVSQFGFVVIRSLPYSPNTFHLRSSEPGSLELLGALDQLASNEEVEWAEPNLLQSPELDAITPPDVLWPGCWDRQLIGCSDAWQRLQDAGLDTYGDPDVIIAVVDSGTQSAGGAPTNPDFQGNVSNGSTKVYQAFDFVNMVANNDAPWDNHGSGVAGITSALAGNPAPIAGQSLGVVGSAPNCRLITIAHGGTETTTADIYIWAAGFNPNSPLTGFPAPISPGADVFTCSLGLGAGAPLSGTAKAMLDFVTSFGRGGKGCLCFFSTGNGNSDNTTNRPYSAYQKSFGIAATSFADDGVTEIRAPYSGHGKIALCAPSHDQFPTFHNPPTGFATWSAHHAGAGNLISYRAIETTLSAASAAGANTLSLANVAGLAMSQVIHVGVIGANGSEPARITAVNAMTNTITVQGWTSAGAWAGGLINAHTAGDPVAQGPAGHRNNFGGTSSATPLTAGAAALVLSAEPDLTWVEARQILRDTAVKFDLTNTDPVGQWLDANGNPSNMSGLPAVRSGWYGYGRVDVDAAVQQALAFGFTRDIVVRDNLADTGAVPTSGAFWNSPDIWVRNASPATEGAAALPANYATAGPHLDAIAGQSNWVYARVRNNGTAASLDCFVRISLTHWPGTEFTYPTSFIPSTRPGAPLPTPLVTGTYLIGEVMVSGIPAGTDQIVNVEWPAALIPPETIMVGTTNVRWHPCLLVECSPLDGPTTGGNHVWDSNSLAQKNITIVYADVETDFAMGIVVGSEENLSEYLVLEIDRGYLPRQVELYVDLVSPILMRRLRKAGKLEPERGYQTMTYELAEANPEIRLTKARGIMIETETGAATLGGGLPLKLSQPTRLEWLPFGYPGRHLRQPRSYKIRHYKGREVAFLAPRGRTQIPIYGGTATLHPIIIGGIVGKEATPGEYSISIVQRDPDGKITGSAELSIRVRE